MDNHLIWVMPNINLGNCHKSLQNYHVLFVKLYGMVNEQRYLHYTEIQQYMSCATHLWKGDCLQVSTDLNPSTSAHEQGGLGRQKRP